MTSGARRRLPPEQRERQVLDAAAKVFSRSGFHDASMDAVAEEAGVSKPMVYTHGGGSKEELFARCIRREADRLLRAVSPPGSAAERSEGHPSAARAAVTTAERSEGHPSAARAAVTTAAGTDPELRLFHGLRAFFTTVTTHREGWMVLYRQARTGPFAGEVHQARHGIVTRVAELLADEAVDPASARPVASTLVGAAEGLADWWFDGGSDSGAGPDDLAAHLMSVLWPGLSALRAGRVWEIPVPRAR